MEDTTELRTAAAYMQAAEEIFRRRHWDLSGEQQDLEWKRFCSSLASAYPPELSWTTGWPGGPQVTSSDDTAQALQLTRSQDLSVQSAPEPLSRSPTSATGHAMASTSSASSRHHRSFTANRYTAGPANRPSRKRRQPQLPPVIAEYDLPQYLTANGLPANYYPDRTHLSVTTAVTPDRAYSFDGSSTPSTPALTDTSVLSSQMMSQNGNFDSSYNDISQGVGMFRFNSNASNISFSGGDSKASFDFSADFSDNCSAAFAPSHQSDLVTHGLALSTTSAFNLPSESNQAFSSQFSTATDALAIERSCSSASLESDSSTSQSRSYRSRHQEHIRQAKKCHIAPKEDPSKKSTQMVRVKSSDGTVQLKASIPRKMPYQRPPQERQYCKYCDEHPNGFRGEHELQRHISRAHPNGIRKVWICEDLNGSDSSFLASCRACIQRKPYGADYNAAAHLRRAHFNPRKRGRKPKNEAEKRGGMGGGKQPPIEFLKANWMREVEEVVDDTSAAVDYAHELEEEQLEVPELSTSFEDQPSISLDDVSPDDYESLWQSQAFQYAAAIDEGLVASQFDVAIDGASDPSFNYDVQTSEHAFASPELGVFQFEDSLNWPQ